MSEKLEALTYISVCLQPAQSAHSIYVSSICAELARRTNNFLLIACAPNRVAESELQWTWYSEGRHIRLIRLLSTATRARPWLLGLSILVSRPSLFSGPVIVDNPVIAAVLRARGARFFYDAHAIGRRARLLRYALNGKTTLGCICNSPRMRDSVLRRFNKVLPTLVLGPGINAKAFDRLPDSKSARSTCRVPLERTVLAHVGSIGEDRGIDLILDAAARLQATMPKLLWLFVGGHAEQIVHWENVAERLGITKDTYRFVPHQPQEKLPLWYACANILCAPYPSRIATADVMSPMKLVEYRATGKPIVAADLPAVRAALEGAGNTYLFSPDSVEAMVAAVDNCLTESSQFPRATVSSRRAVDGWDVRATELIEWIHETLAERRA